MSNFIVYGVNISKGLMAFLVMNNGVESRFFGQPFQDRGPAVSALRPAGRVGCTSQAQHRAFHVGQGKMHLMGD